ncbi:GNAT family N-acetyltransferase [Pseudohongiella sp. SYSU M77423]|uniref:GNAT family N-acetyltransferase n=1 Tax=Pseudohongiella sp. SYSU M77423 TaxID=3042312 RepID=UPI0024810550|nr:GNAT family N-acetyltransferase [Pseudohongiella sp. SYSU M77423]MDH7945161.1 GNAT family N-acetyltransferase [Pseudohongiella sp. SYSU M77423]
MEAQPILKTSRLTLRPFSLSDAPRVKELAGDPRVSEMTINIPHPYEDGMAEEWISSHAKLFASGERIVYAVTMTDTEELIGTVSLTELTETGGNLGYWIGVPYWGYGYCTEAAGALVDFGLTEIGLPLVYARHLPENHASGRVMIKNGFNHVRTVSMDIQGETRLMEHYERIA